MNGAFCPVLVSWTDIQLACRDLRRYDYGAVSRWTRPKRLQASGQASVSILECDRVIAPVHLGVHWTCAMADLTNQEFHYYDSMGVRRRSPRALCSTLTPTLTVCAVLKPQIKKTCVLVRDAGMA